MPWASWCDIAGILARAIAARPARDTVKRGTRVDESIVVSGTIPRDEVYLAQTPQAFRRDVLADAIRLGRSGVAATDEAMLAERAGHPVHIVESDETNLKVTTPRDLAFAEALINRVSGIGHSCRVGIGYDLHRLVEGRPLILGGVTIPFDDAGLVETTDFFRCRDGRWVFNVCSLPRLRQLACAVLDCQATHKAFAERCLRWNAAELEEAMSAVPALNAEYRDLARQLDGMPPTDSSAAIRRLRELVQQLGVPDAITSEVRRRFPSNAGLIVRSSANCEDLQEFAGAGLYESVLNVSPSDVAAAIRTVWSSLWTQRAALSRQQVGLPHEQAHMAVLIQELIDPDFSFILHTVNPISQRVQEVYAEIVVGLGDVLASAAASSPPSAAST